MSDVDPGTEEQASEEQASEEDPLARALAEFAPSGGVVYPENDVMRAALSGGMAAGNTDEVPAGTDEVRSAMTERLRNAEAGQGQVQAERQERRMVGVGGRGEAEQGEIGRGEPDDVA